MSATDASAPPPRRRPILALLIFGLAGLGFAWLAWSQLDAVRSLARNGVRAEATVADMEVRISRKSGSTYYPIFTWRTPEGRVVRERSAASVSRDAYPIGRRSQILHHPSDTATVRSVESVNQGPEDGDTIAGAMALLGPALGGFVLFMHLRPPRAPAAQGG